MGMGGEEFLRRYDAGDFDRIHDDGEHIEFVELEMLIPWGRWAPSALVRPQKALLTSSILSSGPSRA